MLHIQNICSSTRNTEEAMRKEYYSQTGIERNGDYGLNICSKLFN